jgi:hypothetical protein
MHSKLSLFGISALYSSSSANAMEWDFGETIATYSDKLANYNFYSSSRGEDAVEEESATIATLDFDLTTAEWG